MFPSRVVPSGSGYFEAQWVQRQRARAHSNVKLPLASNSFPRNPSAFMAGLAPDRLLLPPSGRRPRRKHYESPSARDRRCWSRTKSTRLPYHTVCHHVCIIPTNGHCLFSCRRTSLSAPAGERPGGRRISRSCIVACRGTRTDVGRRFMLGRTAARPRGGILIPRFRLPLLAIRTAFRWNRLTLRPPRQMLKKVHCGRGAVERTRLRVMSGSDARLLSAQALIAGVDGVLN